MPYINARDYQRAITRPRNVGELNYAITMLMIHYVEDQTTLGHGLTQPVNYALLNSVVGAVQSAKDEFCRRVVAPYEDTKIASNGDVYPAWLVGQGARGSVEGERPARPTTGPLPPPWDSAREAPGRFSLHPAGPASSKPPQSSQPPTDVAVMAKALDEGHSVSDALTLARKPVEVCGHADSSHSAEFPMPPVVQPVYQVAEETQSVPVPDEDDNIPF